MDNDLINQASEARQAAYAPYSGFQVGAALLTASGKIFRGCNVENISLGLTICAERAAVLAAVAAGERVFKGIAIVSDSHEPIVPCGACRQVLAEFNTDLMIQSATIDGTRANYLLRDLLPLPNRGLELGKVPHGT
jgi:cytidine deaminase